MSVSAWPLVLADEACLDPMRYRLADGSEPAPCATCLAWAGSTLMRAATGGRQGWNAWAAHEARAPVQEVRA